MSYTQNFPMDFSVSLQSEWIFNTECHGNIDVKRFKQSVNKTFF